MRYVSLSILHQCTRYAHMNKPTHLQFIIAAANMRAYNYGLAGSSDSNIFKSVASSINVPKFVPRHDVTIDLKDGEQTAKSPAPGKYHLLELDEMHSWLQVTGLMTSSKIFLLHPLWPIFDSTLLNSRKTMIAITISISSPLRPTFVQ